MWPCTKNGEYSIKLGYQRLKQKEYSRDIGPSSSHIINKEVWKVKWSLKTPSKIKNFLWRCCNNALHVSEQIWKRKVMRSPICGICGVEEEIVEHILLTCEWTKMVWFECWFGIRMCKERVTTFDRWMSESMENLRKERREELMTDMAFICWQIWKARCEAVICKRYIDNGSIIFRIKRGVSEYYQYNKKMNSENKRVETSLNKESRKGKKEKIEISMMMASHLTGEK